MDIDMSILRMLEREKEISFDVLVETIEQALLTAYHKTPGAQPRARVELDRKSGRVTVYAPELDEEGNVVAEYDDTPEGFGRVAATTAKQIMLQRFRDAEDELRFGEFSGKEGDIVSGVIQQGRNPDDDVAVAPRELAEAELVLGVAQALEHDLLGGGGRDAPEAVGGVVVLPDRLALVVELRHEDGDVAGLAVDFHACPRLRARGLLIGGEQRLLDRLDEHVEGDLLLTLQHPQDAQVDVHQSSPSSSLLLRLNSTCTRALATSA